MLFSHPDLFLWIFPSFSVCNRLYLWGAGGWVMLDRSPVYHIANTSESPIKWEYKVHPKLKIQSLSSHSHADGKLGEVSLPTNHFWNFKAQWVAALSSTNETDVDFKQKQNENGSIQLAQCNPSLKIPNWFKKTFLHPRHVVQFVHPLQLGCLLIFLA